jgi:hypothetical protein
MRERGIAIDARDGRLRISAPAGAIDEELRLELARRKQELLRELESEGNPEAPEKLTPMDRSGKIPQTEAQQGLWLIDHFSSGNVSYNIPQAFMVEGEIDRDLLQSASNELLMRHEALRTGFYEDGGELLQFVQSACKTEVGFTDLSAIAERDQDAALRARMRTQGRRPFQLDHPPLIRFHLFRLSPQKYVSFFNVHHIVADRRSLVILRDELRELYRAAALNCAANLAPLPIQYPDFAIWSGRRLASGALAGQLDYWKKKLAGVPPFLELPVSRAYPEHRTPWGKTLPLTMTAPLRDAVGELARQENATAFMVLLSAYAAFLYKCSGQADFCVGTPFTHRNQVETEGIVGLFVNMLPLRCQVDPQRGFRDLLRQVRVTSLEAYENSDLPFQEVVRMLRPPPKLGRTPFFQVMFGFDADDRPAPQDLVQIDTAPGTARFALTLQLDARPDGIEGTFEYCTDVLDDSQVRRWAYQFPALLEALILDPDRPLGDIALAQEPDTSLEDAVKPPTEPEVHPWRGRMTKWFGRSAQRE